MFTGIIEAMGHIVAIEPSGLDFRLQIGSKDLDKSDLKLGDSVAVNGICLTVTELTGEGFWADVSAETLQHTTFKEVKAGTRVNLEKALTLATRLGGHLVSGHIDAIGRVISRERDGRSEHFVLSAPEQLLKYIAPKGSITVDGISLTANRVESNQIHLNIVPHTLGETTLARCRAGSQVNLEVDLLARYLERLLQSSDTPPSSQVTKTLLAENGFI